jgi:hypothetical protein
VSLNRATPMEIEHLLRLTPQIPIGLNRSTPRARLYHDRELTLWSRLSMVSFGFAPEFVAALSIQCETAASAARGKFCVRTRWFCTSIRRTRWKRPHRGGRSAWNRMHFYLGQAVLRRTRRQLA